MVSIYKCDYCGKDRTKELKPQLSCGSVDLVRIDDVDLCNDCKKEIREMVLDIIKRRKALGGL